MNPLLGQLLAGRPPAFAAVEAPARCAECGRPTREDDDTRWLMAQEQTLCAICQLGWTAAWESDQVHLLLIPDWSQGLLNRVFVRLSLTLMVENSGSAIERMRQEQWLTALQARATTTRQALPLTASASQLRQTWLALPSAQRDSLTPMLEALRYLPNVEHPAIADWLRQRLPKTVT
ncbi:MAG: hypothetical protein H6970_16045 [Gammaproteobacteria bacterium]|nr:hypothetical protein [Gammaproteobacteria bacterium]MCP5458737.1 hypothetical protein [Gammaproteobacteria bacterium]MCP5460084.1 hypothetical protein [Gammaproteobacteria bacterium]